MADLLATWFNLFQAKISKLGFTATIIKENNGKSTSVNFDRDDYVGTICFWEPDTVEIQVNDCVTGEVAYLETKEITSVDELTKKVSEVFEQLAIG